jgi:hypothetical protein
MQICNTSAGTGVGRQPCQLLEHHFVSPQPDINDARMVATAFLGSAYEGGLDAGRAGVADR